MKITFGIRNVKNLTFFACITSACHAGLFSFLSLLDPEKRGMQRCFFTHNFIFVAD